MRIRLMLVAMAAAALVVAGCGGSSSSSSGSSSSTAAAAPAPASTSASATAAPAAAPTAGGATTVRLAAVPGKLAFNTKQLSAKAGTVTLVMANPSSFPHGISVEGHGVDSGGKVVSTGGVSKVTVKLKPGTYTFYCPVPGHRQAGMQGTLTVT